jgi:hypothetical protein
VVAPWVVLNSSSIKNRSAGFMGAKYYVERWDAMGLNVLDVGRY